MNEIKAELKIDALRWNLIRLIQLLMDNDENFREELEKMLLRLADKV